MNSTLIVNRIIKTVYFVDKNVLFVEKKKDFFLSLCHNINALHGKLYHHSRFIPWSDAIF